jgi:hypothetical protein
MWKGNLSNEGYRGYVYEGNIYRNSDFILYAYNND